MLIAALPPADPPAPTVAGVHVSWPVTKPETGLAPGTKIVVTVSSSRRSSQVSLARVDGRGRTMRVIAKRTLRRGTFSAKLPAAAPARYALRLRVSGRKHWSWITTPGPSTAPAAPPVPVPVAAATPTPTPTPLPFCTGPELPSTEFRGEVHLQAASVQAGQTLAYTIVSLGQGTLTDWAVHTLVPDPPGLSGWAGGGSPTPLAPGVPVAYTQDIPATTVPGMYRIDHAVTWGQCDYIVPTSLESEPFEVTAP